MREPPVNAVIEGLARLSDAERKLVYDTYVDNYCPGCGAYTGCDCPDCVCPCRKPAAAEVDAPMKPRQEV